MGIEIRNITKKYGKKTALDSVSLEFEKGKIYGLLGRNGAGKSTLLNIIDGRSTGFDGKIYIDGKKHSNKDRLYFEDIFLISEDNLYPPDMSIDEIFKQTEKFRKTFDRKRANAMLDSFGLKAKSRVKELSTGGNTAFKNIIGLCINAPYVFFDEPTLGLDVIARSELWDLIRELKGKITVILTTHYMEEAGALSDRVGIMKNGKLLAVGTPAELNEKTGANRLEDAFLKIVKGETK